MTTIRVAGLYRYPVKSMRGTAHAAIDVDARGFCFDRRWMLTDNNGHFLTQRELPRMALVAAQIGDDGRLVLSAPGMPDIVVGSADSARVQATVWEDSVDALACDATVDAWLATFLGRPCHLVAFANDVTRPVDPDFGRPTDHTGFADGFPFLLLSTASLDGLNAKLAQALPMQRFRPNIVVEGCAPHAEDDWRVIRIGGIVFRVVKPCARCSITTVDPLTAERGVEPLRTLATYRRRNNQIFFGQNLIHNGNGKGRLETGMSVEVLE